MNRPELDSEFRRRVWEEHQRKKSPSMGAGMLLVKIFAITLGVAAVAAAGLALGLGPDKP